MVVRRTSTSPSLSSFFGLTSKYRSELFQQIHEIVFHGNGGYDWFTVYNMPIWLRKYTIEQIRSFYEKKQKVEEEASKSISKAFNKKSSKPFTTKKAPK